MNLQQIKLAIAEGKKVYCDTLAYEVILDSKGQYLIKCGSHCIGLTWADEITLNAKESSFFIHQQENRLNERISHEKAHCIAISDSFNTIEN